MRLFVAVNFNDDTRSRLIALRDGLRARSVRGNFTTPENIHLTLAFLGECNEKQAVNAKAAMEAVRFEPIEIIIERVGQFKRPGGSLWWAGAKATESLLGAQRDLTLRLSETGFTLDRRSYSPHITIGREVETDAKPWDIDRFGETARFLDLMLSERVGGKLTYTPIYRKPAA